MDSTQAEPRAIFGQVLHQRWRYLVAVAISVAAAGWIVQYAYQNEETFARLAFVCSASALIVTSLLVLTRRIAFSIITMAAIVALVVVASPIKRQQMNMGLHAYDLFFYFNVSTIQFLWADYKSYLLAFVGSIAAFVAIASLSYRFDPTRLPRRPAAPLLICFLLATIGTGQIADKERYAGFLFFGSGGVLSSFYLSWAETGSALWSGHLIEAAARTARAPFRQTACAPARRPPHILLIHHESLAPPEIFKGVNYDRSLDQFFKSPEDRLRKLRVEIYGGGSWLSEFSILTGLSSFAFGNIKTFVQVFMAGKLAETLPQYLASCGYRNVLFSTANRNFVSNAKFYEGIGLTVYDRKDQGAPTVRERDRFYYSNVLAELQRHTEKSKAPIFVYIQTNASHFPYDSPLAPELSVSGGGAGTSPEIHEWLRRAAIAKWDYEFLVSELARRFPAEKFLIVRYGDHQPAATRPLLGLPIATARKSYDVRPEEHPNAFLTFYVVQGQNYAVPPLPIHDVLDIPYLGTIILEAAGLPLSEAHDERKRLMAICDGSYFGCPRQDEILVFHRRLIDAGLIH